MIKNILLLLLLSISTVAFSQKTLLNCEECSARYISQKEIQGFGDLKYYILKNEILARKGYMFSEQDLATYFSQYEWYKPLKNPHQLNEYEKANIQKILSSMEKPNGKFVINSKYRYMTKGEINTVFSDDLGIEYNILQAYKYLDKSGNKSYLVLTENNYTPQNIEYEKINKIHAYGFRQQGEKLLKDFSIYDFIDTKNDYVDDIHFYTRYICTEDFDGDGFFDPIIIYGLSSDNNHDNSSVKILTFYKGAKYKIEISNSPFDNERSIKIDPAFYKLPQSIQDAVILQMGAMYDNKHCYYGHYWKEQMRDKVTYIRDYPRNKNYDKD